MGNWLSKNLNKIIIGSFLIPILLVAFVSISHVTTFYNLANPFSWAIYLSIAVEIAALAALAGVSAKFGKFIYLPFGIVTFIQLLGNFFFSYTWIDMNSKDFKDWMDMIAPMLEPLGIEPTDATSHRRILGFFTGGLLPFISLTFAHMLIVYSNKLKSGETTKEEVEEEETIKPMELTEEQIIEISKKVGQQEAEKEKNHFVPTEEDLQNIEQVLKSFEKEKVEETEVVEQIQEELITEEKTEEVEDNLTTEETTEAYFVDDEEIKIEEPPTEEEQPKIKRLTYSK
jgi:hypothetical protein